MKYEHFYWKTVESISDSIDTEFLFSKEKHKAIAWGIVLFFINASVRGTDCWVWGGEVWPESWELGLSDCPVIDRLETLTGWHRIFLQNIELCFLCWASVPPSRWPWGAQLWGMLDLPLTAERERAGVSQQKGARKKPHRICVWAGPGMGFCSRLAALGKWGGQFCDRVAQWISSSGSQTGMKMRASVVN